MQIEEGKFYRTREGKKVGPMTRRSDGIGSFFTWAIMGLPPDAENLYSENGQWNEGYENRRDLIAEWHEPDEIPVEITLINLHYQPLMDVLTDAFNHAVIGKGKERHANGQPFTEQPIMEIGRMLDSTAGHAHQIIKKAQEGNRMAGRADYIAAEAEFLGIINYAAAAVLLLREFEKQDFADVKPASAE